MSKGNVGLLASFAVAAVVGFWLFLVWDPIDGPPNAAATYGVVFLLLVFIPPEAET